jgi:hypothetical protein
MLTSIARNCRRVLSTFLVVSTLSAPAHAKETRVHLELVLAIDVSASVDLSEFNLQLQGIAEAFSDPEVLKAIEGLRPLGAAIAVVQWGGPEEFRINLPFTHIVTAQDAKAFGFLVSRNHRFIGATSTAIASAMQQSADLFEGNGFDGGRLVIDISGDGVDNSGLDLEATRQNLLLRHITVNGLAIEQDDQAIAQYYKDYVILGPDSFVERADGYSDFARAIKAKLLKELQPNSS